MAGFTSKTFCKIVSQKFPHVEAFCYFYIIKLTTKHMKLTKQQIAEIIMAMPPIIAIIYTIVA